MAKKSSSDERILRAMAKAAETRLKFEEESKLEEVVDTSVDDFLDDDATNCTPDTTNCTPDTTNCTPEPVSCTPEVVIEPKAPQLTAHQLFASWMRTNKGRDAADPRLPTDFTRLCVELEDRLRIAFEAGLNIGRES